MKQRKRGRPFKRDEEKQTEQLLVMVQGPEKLAFKSAASLAGASLSSWVRQRLRTAATSELGCAGKPVAFLDGLDKSEPKPINKRQMIEN